MRPKSTYGPVITSPPGYLDEGLFGRVFLWIFEILPYLQRNNIYPQWHIPSSLYGVGADHLAIPGILDLAYEPPQQITHEISLVDLRNKHSSSLGPEWTAVQALWNLYFRIPERVNHSADAVPITSTTLGIHFRGTDKHQSAWDTNSLSGSEMVLMAEDYISSHSGITKIFVATDEADFIDLLKARVGLEVISLGGAKHHKEDVGAARTNYADADRALLDSVLLSRCSSVLLTSSALSAFAKIFNPDLSIFRCSASKMLWEGPYFPVAYIPVYEPKTEECRRILARTLEGDWLQSPGRKSFQHSFVSKPNWNWRLKALKRAIKRRVHAMQGRPVQTPVPYFHR
jgi:hypothetical protein